MPWSARVFTQDQLKLDPSTMGALGPDGHPVVHPAEFWKQFSQPEITHFCARQGLYCIPTQELVDWLRDEIGGRSAIEIGAGNGVLAAALGILATDNKMQQRPEIEALYKALGQATVKYGGAVVQYHAEVAVKALQPEVVVGAWVTHRYDPNQPERGGNALGVVEEEIVKTTSYVFIGNQTAHRAKPILELPHREYRFPWLVSRGFNPEDNFIAVWG